jgi:NAD-dependent dihydropyrimidine dehydrogenase PreA subunit
MAYFITDECIGCLQCLLKCPVDAITGDRNMLHIIDPEVCIDCGACGMVCPVEAIHDQFGEVCKFIVRPTHRPIAVIYEELCSGCDFCVQICKDAIRVESPVLLELAEAAD